MNRPTELDRALASVRRGSTQPFELLVSDDGTGPETAQIAARHGATYQRGPSRGLGPNRNACLDAVSGSHVAFIDDDVEVSPEFVSTANRVASDDIVTGWERNHGRGTAEKVTSSNPSFLGFQNRPVGEVRRSIVINATVFPAHLFRLARFDEATRYGYEELDMARQAVARGYRIHYSDDLWVDHFPSPVNREQYARVQAASRIYLTARAYRRYERNLPKAVMYCAVASVHHIAYTMRRKRGVKAAFEPLLLASQYAAKGSKRPAAKPSGGA